MVFKGEDPAAMRATAADSSAVGYPPGRRPSRSRLTTITVTDHAAASTRRSHLPSIYIKV